MAQVQSILELRQPFEAPPEEDRLVLRKCPTSIPRPPILPSGFRLPTRAGILYAVLLFRQNVAAGL